MAFRCVHAAARARLWTIRRPRAFRCSRDAARTLRHDAPVSDLRASAEHFVHRLKADAARCEGALLDPTGPKSPTSTPTPSGRHPGLRARLTCWSGSVLVLLIVQHVLGLYLQLVSPLPEGLGLVSTVASDAVLAAHVSIALLILQATGVVFFLAACSRRLVLWAPASLGLAITFVAFESGLEFIIGGQEIVFSVPMSLLFVGIVGSDLLILFWLTRRAAVPKLFTRDLLKKVLPRERQARPSRARLARRARPQHEGRS